MERIGVFVCHCGTNIAGTVDVAKVAEELMLLNCGVGEDESLGLQGDPTSQS